MASRSRVDRRVEAKSESRGRSEIESEKSRDRQKSRLKVDLLSRPQVDLKSRRDIDHDIDFHIPGRNVDRDDDRTLGRATGEKLLS